MTNTNPTMADKSKRREKRFITEDDVSTLLQRYSVNTVLALLQEVGQVAGEKIDWQEMVKKTATGISSAREYQMLWRHLAYGETLTDQFEHVDAIMDDDSDLEYEVVAFPDVGRDASADAVACVKVLIASGYDSHLPSNLTIEAPLTINIPNSRAVPAPSDSSILTYAMHGTNINIPATLQKQPLPSSVCGEKRPNDGASGANLPPRRRRRAWSTEEDMKLIAAVQKYGEGNWANIAKGDFHNDRNSSELSQRWSNLKKKQGNLKVGTTSSQPAETQLAAAHRAMSLALDIPMGDNSKAVRQITIGIKSQQQPQKPSATPPDQQSGRAAPTKPQIPAQRPSPTPDSMVKAAAVAAGARIATSADASSLMEAARSQNVVHITTACSSTSVMKSSTTTTSINNQLPSNVHFIRNGLAKAPISTYSSAKPNISRPCHSINPSVSAVQPNHPAGPAPSSSAVELHRTAGKVSTSRTEIEVPVQRHRGAERVQRAPDNQSAALGNQSEELENHQTSVSISDPVSQTKDEGSGKENTNRQCPSKGYS